MRSSKMTDNIDKRFEDTEEVLNVFGFEETEEEFENRMKLRSLKDKGKSKKLIEYDNEIEGYGEDEFEEDDSNLNTLDWTESVTNEKYKEKHKEMLDKFNSGIRVGGVESPKKVEKERVKKQINMADVLNGKVKDKRRIKMHSMENIIQAESYDEDEHIEFLILDVNDINKILKNPTGVAERITEIANESIEYVQLPAVSELSLHNINRYKNTMRVLMKFIRSLRKERDKVSVVMTSNVRKMYRDAKFNEIRELGETIDEFMIGIKSIIILDIDKFSIDPITSHTTSRALSDIKIIKKFNPQIQTELKIIADAISLNKDINRINFLNDIQPKLVDYTTEVEDYIEGIISNIGTKPSEKEVGYIITLNQYTRIFPNDKYENSVNRNIKI